MALPLAVATLLLLLLTSSLTIRLIRFLLATRRPPNFPPGPPTLPLLGNMHQVPIKHPFLRFTEWAPQYPILGLKLGPTNAVVVNRAEHIRELYEKRGADYNARPRFAIPFDYIWTGEGDRYIAFMDGERQRFQRAGCREHLSMQGIERIAPVQRAMVVAFLKRLATPDLSADGQAFVGHLHHWTLGVGAALIVGRRIEDLGGDSWVHSYHDVQEKMLELLQPGYAPPLDMVPWLAYLPFWPHPWKEQAAAVRKGVYDTYNSLLGHAKKDFDALPEEQKKSDREDRERRLRADKYEPLLVSLLRDRLSQGSTYTEHEIGILGGGLLDALSHTTQGAALFFLQAMAAHPVVQRRAQQEIDAVCPNDTTLPTGPFTASRFHYLHACILESLRWRPTVPAPIPRIISVDDNDVFGYSIPKGSLIIANVWAIHHNPDDYDDPSAYNPDRFLNNRWGLRPELVPAHPGGDNDRDHPLAWRKSTYAFNAGRRGCQGEAFAMDALLTLAVLMLWSYELVVDEKGINLDPATSIHPGGSVAPEPFKVKFVERGDRVRTGVMSENERAERELDGFLSSSG